MELLSCQFFSGGMTEALTEIPIDKSGFFYNKAGKEVTILGKREWRISYKQKSPATRPGILKLLGFSYFAPAI